MGLPLAMQLTGTTPPWGRVRVPSTEPSLRSTIVSCAGVLLKRHVPEQVRVLGAALEQLEKSAAS